MRGLGNLAPPGGAPGWLKKAAAWGGWILALMQAIMNSWPGGSPGGP